MPKRKAEEDKINRYKAKIKKLERKQNKRRLKRIISDSESDIENEGKL